MSELITMDLIVVEQIPKIKERCEDAAAEIDKRLSIVDSLVCTEESLKDIKKIRADFNKELAVVEKLRIEVKEKVLNPYDDFLAVYNRCIRDKYAAAKKTLDTKIGEVESELRTRKEEKIKAYYNEYAKSSLVTEYADFDRQMGGFRTSDSEASLKKACKAHIDRIASDIKAIETQPEELQAEILAEFKKLLSATDAITIVSDRHKAIKEQMEAQQARETAQAAEAGAEAKVNEATATAPLAPPTAIASPTAAPTAPPIDPNKIVTVPFKVTATYQKVKELKQYLINGGYQFE
jgi:hypothetical protein